MFSPTTTNVSLGMNGVGVLIHGCHLQALEWEKVVFGDKTHLGRVPTALDEAINKKAQLIFWGTGASQTLEGIKESEYTYEQATHSKLEELACIVKKDPSELLKYLDQVSFIDREYKNTKEEVQVAIRECQLRGIKELVLISSPTHIARCLQEACKLKEQSQVKIKVYARASDTCYVHGTAADVVIFEPPHRGDKPKVCINQTIKNILPFMKEENIAISFNHALMDFIENYRQKVLLKRE